METSGQLTIYRSSAGSGKTFTLVREYLRLVMTDPNAFRRILAITFTNKATEEMKSRIIDQLVKIAGGGALPYVREHLKLDYSEEQAQQQAQEALSNILHDYSGFAISTIDSFFSSMVRNLARELNLPMRFEMELGQDHVIRQITFDLFEDIEKDPELRHWLEDFLMDMLDNDKGWRMEPKIHDTAKQLFTDVFRDTHESGQAIPDAELISRLKKIKAEVETAMISFGQRMQDVFSRNGLSPEDFSRKSGGPAGYALKLQQSRTRFPEFSQTFIKASEDPAAWVTKSSPIASTLLPLAEQTLVPLAAEILRYYESRGPEYHGSVEALKVIYLSGLLGRLHTKLKMYRDETDTILLSDVNYMLRKAIGPDDAPFIYEKAGNRFRHFMLDEFQDTSTTQWKNLLPLLINSLSTGNSSLIVGDAKQSIYRWRGGDMQLLQVGVVNDLHAFKSLIQPRFLGKNFRSWEHVIRFNNQFFPKAAQLLSAKLGSSTSELLTSVYHPDNVAQEIRDDRQGAGYVSVRFYERKEKESSFSEDPDEEGAASGWKFRSMEDTCDKIKDLEKQGYRLGEMVILCRTNDDALQVTAHLLSRGITNVISPESLLLEGSPAIRFLISLLKFITDPSDPIALAHLSYYYDKGATPLHELLTSERKTLLAKLPQEFISRMTELRTITLYETVEELCRIFGLIDTPDAYIQRFHDLVQEYVNSNAPGIRDFLDWWDENRDSDKCSVILPPGKNAIRIMSIHKSKGLEFRIVFIPFCSWDFVPKHYGLMWASSDVEPFNELNAHLVHPVKELKRSVFRDDYEQEYGMTAIDNLNMLYVAFTRAEEQLYIHGAAPGKDRKPESQYNASTLLFDALMADPSWKPQFESTGGAEGFAGVLPPALKQDAETETHPELRTWTSIPWKDKLWLGVNKRKISISDPELPDTRYGNLFHDVMASFRSVEQSDDIALLVAAKLKGSDGEFLDRLVREVGFVIGEGQKRGWFSSGSRIFSEQDILTTGGKLFRPDRVIVNESGEVQLIDYKTGEAEEWHADQIRQYGDLLIKMGFQVPKMFVVYPALKTVAEIRS